MLDLIKNKKIRLYKTMNIVNPLVPISTDEMFLRSNMNDDDCIMHFYALPNSVILGAPDTRIPFFNEALFAFYRRNVIPAVRNIGGLGIIADKGVLNFSIVLKKQPDKFSIRAGYDLMTAFINELFPEGRDKIKAIEISNSYCPGDYDLSINGKKFAGVAQRMVSNAFVVSIYISVFGDQNRRANMMREFYDIGIKDQQLNYKYPVVDERYMDTLENLLHKKLTFEDVFERTTKLLYSLDCDIVDGEYTDEMVENYEKIYSQAKERNDRFLEQ